MERMNRRDFARLCFLASSGCVLAQDSLKGTKKAIDLDTLRFKKEDNFPPREARFWDKLAGLKIQCKLCPQSCTVADQERGTCGVRENRGGTYFTLVHSRVCAMHVDPIEKKPLFHYLPGTSAFSIATPGCNMECKYCQNWQISQFRPEQVECVPLSPETVATLAKKNEAPTVAFTYSEPVIYYEYMADVATAARRVGIGSVMISNGFIQVEPLRQLIPKLSAIKIDFKGFSESFYADICRGRLKPVLEALTVIAQSRIWFELVMLVVPTLNDSVTENSAMFKWIRQNLGDQVPVHLTRFHPMYKLPNLPSTPVATLERLYREAKNAGLKFVYLGNVNGHPAESTYCPSCSATLIRRVGFEVVENTMKQNRCPGCGAMIPGVFRS